MSDFNTPRDMYATIAMLNNLRFEGNVCGECLGGTVYQVSIVEDINNISTPSNSEIAKSFDPGIVVSCCLCGEGVNWAYAGIRGR